MASLSKNDTQKMHSSYLSGYNLSHPEPGEDVVITGLSGCYPDSDNVDDFRKNLFNKMYLSGGTHRPWKINNPEVPAAGGRIRDMNKFDAAFFGIHSTQAHVMDSMTRKLLERSFEAIIDAGLHPGEIKGTNTGVFVGACFSEAEKYWLYEKPGKFSVTGCIRAANPYRVSKALEVNGPSYVVDTACSSSMYAVEHAYRAIRTGLCDNAIVGGCNICLHPYVTLQFWRLGVLNSDGKCKCFDESADGYTRSEAVVAIFLQKSKNARRIYAHFVHAKTNCDGYKEYGITYPSGQIQTYLLNEFYSECTIDPKSIEYIEAHGTGTRVGDPEEVAGIDTVFCKDRQKPLLIGSVKSNIGHTEGASGLCSITKAILSMESGYLIPNINFNTPRKEMDGVLKGRIQVLTEKQPWKGGYMPVSSFGFGGANCHVLLKSNSKEKINYGLPRDDIPRLVYASGRTEEAVNTIFDDLENRTLDAEYVRLLQEIFKKDIRGHIYRGYAILSKESLLTRKIELWSHKKRDLWYIFSGLSSQWPGMGEHLLSIPVFAATIERCHQILSPLGVNVVDIIVSKNKNIFTNMTNTLVGITAVQIGLADLLTAVDLKPVGTIGHSVGEIACAYYNKCLTLDQAILCSYYLGKFITKFKKDAGVMLSINVGHEEIKPLLPKDIQVACYNSEHNCVLTGSYNIVKEFERELNEYDIITNEMKTNNTPLHSSYMEQTAQALLLKLKDIIRVPKLRPENWLSASVLNPTTHFYKYCSAEYLTNMICGSVFFEEIYNKISRNIVAVEISPSGVLQNSVGTSINNESISLQVLEENAHTVESFLTAIGKLYLAGFNPHIENIYPKVNYPVSRGTPMLSHLLKWDHSENWHVSLYDANENIKSGESIFTIKLQYEECEYFSGHNIDGRVLFPATGYLELIWDTVSFIQGQNSADTPIVFENVKYLRATNIPKEGWLFLTVRILKVSGYFEVVDGTAPLVTGSYYFPKNIQEEMSQLPIPVMNNVSSNLMLNNRDVYKELRLRGYNYKGLFRSIQSIDLDNKTAEIKWQSNYVSFIDNMLQTQLLFEDTRGLFVPTGIERLYVDTEKQKKFIENLREEKTITAYIYKDIKTVVCGGLELKNVSISAISRRKPLGEPILETYKFVPNKVENVFTSLKECVFALVYIVSSNIVSNKLKTVEVVNDKDEKEILSIDLQECLSNIPLLQADVNIITKNSLEVKGINVSKKQLSTESNCTIVILSNAVENLDKLETAFSVGIPNSFVIARENIDVDLSRLASQNIEVAQEITLESERILLLHKTWKKIAKCYIDLSNSFTSNFEWVTTLQKNIKQDPNTVVYSHGDDLTGLMGFVKCLRKEPGKNDIRCVIVLDKDAPTFDPNHEFYDAQLRKGLAFNVYKNGEWGQYMHTVFKGVENVAAEHGYVNVTTRGDLSSLRWLEGTLSRNNINNKIVDIYYGALNFRDIMTASGRIAPEYVAKGRFEQECVQGLEYSGRLANGRRVMGIVHRGATSTIVASDDVLTWDVPHSWTLQEAATVPCVYATVIFAFDTCQLKPGQAVLIHAGAGGIGQAAINIARLMYKCTVFVTVGTQEKRDFIKNNWPDITDEYIGNSRDVSFVQMIMNKTKGRGVDVVINSLAEKKLLAGVRCLAEGGHFLEIGKFDMAQDNPLPVKMFKKKSSFHGIMLDSFFTYTNIKKQYVHNLLNDAIRKGYVKPLKSTVFERNQIEEAFRYMATGKHMGKVLIRVREEEPEKYAVAAPMKVEVLPRFVSKHGSYIITGGLGGFGLELTDWLILRGVKKVVLNSRRGITTGYQSMRVNIWKTYGIDIIISTDDSTTESGCRKIIEKAMELGPVEAIFNLSVVLKDGLFENQSPESFQESLAPKAIATKYLDEISRELCPQLRKFVIFSSVSCGRGNAGQTNYGMANAIMERICEKRREAGFPALAVEWGAVGDVGLVAEYQEDNTELVIGGTLQQRISNCLTILDKFLTQDETIVSSIVVAEKKAGAEGANNIIDAVANILGIKDFKTISINATLAEVGMDSIMAVEIKQALERDFEVFLTAQDIRSMTFAKLYAIASDETVTKDIVDPESTENNSNEVVTKFGIFQLVRSVDTTEKSRAPVIVFPSQVTANCQERVLLIPGIEGMCSVYEQLASQLNAIPVGLQLLPTYKSDSVPQLAEQLLQLAWDNLNSADNHFTIVGYSYGAAVTLELVSMLEVKGKVGNIILIDGSPDMLRLTATQIFNTMSQHMFENSVILIILRLVLPEEQVIYLRNLYEKLPSWQEKLNCILENRPKDIQQDVDYLKSLCETFYTRIKAILNYQPKYPKLKSTIKLIRPQQHSDICDTEDLGLSKYTENPIEIIYAEGTHVSVVGNLVCAKEINKILSSGIIFKDTIGEMDKLKKFEAIIN